MCKANKLDVGNIPINSFLDCVCYYQSYINQTLCKDIRALYIRIDLASDHIHITYLLRSSMEPMNRMNAVKYLLIILLLLCSCSGNVDKSRLSGMDYRLFNGTIAERLARAVKNGDVETIREEVLNHNIPVDLKNKECGTTLLMMATYHNNLKAARCLLELGADPNLYEDTLGSWGENSVLIASRRITPSPEMLSLLISYGGDPNSQAKGIKYNNVRKPVPMRDFALQVACALSIEKVRILVEAGADVNKVEDSPYTSPSAMYSAIIHNNMDILLYLLQNGADYNMKFIEGDYSKEKTIFTECTILDELRCLRYPLHSERHRQKMEVVKFLANKGLYYSKTPIPDWVIKWAKKEYPDNWEEYLARY